MLLHIFIIKYSYILKFSHYILILSHALAFFAYLFLVKVKKHIMPSLNLGRDIYHHTFLHNRTMCFGLFPNHHLSSNGETVSIPDHSYSSTSSSYQLCLQ